MGDGCHVVYHQNDSPQAHSLAMQDVEHASIYHTFLTFFMLKNVEEQGKVSGNKRLWKCGWFFMVLFHKTRRTKHIDIYWLGCCLSLSILQRFISPGLFVNRGGIVCLQEA